MNSSMWRKALTGAALLGVAGLAAPVSGQQSGAGGHEQVWVIDGGSPDKDYRIPRVSLFNISAEGDEGAATIRNGGHRWCFQNITGFGSRNNFGCRTAFRVRLTGGGTNGAIFDYGLAWAAPPSDLPSTIDPVTSGLKGGGWTFNTTTLIIASAFQGGSGKKLWASDRSATELLSIGVFSTNDAGCTDITGRGFQAGFQLLPISDCAVTIPPSGWKGRHPIPAESYLELQATDPLFGASVDLDPFAFWRVPEELQATEKFFGDFQTYGETTDFFFQSLERYGQLIPGGTGAPVNSGWPLGLTVFWDAFYFNLPSLSNSVFWQATIVNESERVYGVGMDYDSLYLGMNWDPLLQSQSESYYFDADRNGFLYKDTGGRCANATVVLFTCFGRGWTGGPGLAPALGAAMVLLKSPLGDMRYELFNDPTSDFFNPTHPRAGDTITFNTLRQCGFGDCVTRSFSRGQRSSFGTFTSTGHNTLDGEQPGDLSDSQYWRTFRAEAWPVRTGEFNKYIPGISDNKPIWDFNHDGIPDTIYADACGSKGCVTNWSDTMPGNFVNRSGNIGFWSAGPIHLAAGDTVGMTMAIVGAVDSANMEAGIDNAIAFYKNMFLGPEAAPAPRITAVDITGGGTDVAQVTLFWDDLTENWEDPFLLKLDVAADIALNPWLADSIAARITGNPIALHIFKSCDSGSTFTSNAGDCDGDAISDASSKWSGFGWSPYATILVGDDGTFVNSYTDISVFPGVNYTYSIVTETQGATFNVVRGVEGAFTAESVEFAPGLLSGLLTSSTSPNVAALYVPVNLAAGAADATLDTIAETRISNIPLTINVIGSSTVAGDYRVVFVDSIALTEVSATDGSSKQTSLTGFVLRTVTAGDGSDLSVAIQTFEFDRSGSVSHSGLTEASRDESLTQVTTVFAGGGMGLIVTTSGGTPLMVSTTLIDGGTTPGDFFGQEDFPFFTVEIAGDVGGTFNAIRYFRAGADLNIDSDTVSARIRPSVTWLTSGGRAAALGSSQFGDIDITFAGEPFGANAPFNIDQGGVGALFTASVSARPTASNSVASAEALDAIQAEGEAAGLAPEDLVSYALPFTVRNSTYDRDVDVVVTNHVGSTLLSQGSDTLRFDIPAGLWGPGDEIYLLERVTREVTDANGNTVLGGGGQPETEQVLVATFRGMLGCVARREGCDPSIGGTPVDGVVEGSGFVAMQPGQTERVEYFVPLTAADEFTFSVNRAVTADEAALEGGADLSGVHVVPNPYLYASEFERSTAQRVIKFTNLPPEGRLRIFDLAGRFVQQIDYIAADLQGGDLDWDLRTRENLELGSGLYIWVLETDSDRQLGKFVVIR